MGLEPTIFGTTIRRVNQLHYTHHILLSPSTGSLRQGCGTDPFIKYDRFERVNEPGGIRTLDLRLRRPLLYPAELQTHFSLNENLSFSNEKRVMGIEPTYPAWKAGVLPLNYTRRMIGVTGFEPATSWSQTRRSSQAEPHPDISFISLPLRLCVSFVSPAATRYIIWHVSQKVNRFFKVFLLFYDCFFTCFSQEECANCFFCFSFLIIRIIIDIFAQNSIFRPHRLP